ncbi:MAG: guanylate kinase [Actinobacteria bacterium]|nr:MAG: guanylate kinase [Actinomycetota bacterium]
MNTAVLTVIAGPSGVGKGTVVNELRRLHPELVVSVSATTRPPRPGEVDGVNYFFISKEAFDDLIECDGFLEWAEVFGGHRYGTLRSFVEKHLALGKHVLLEIDLKGARQVKTAMPEAHMFFIAPPSLDELKQRLRNRGTETVEQQEQRLAIARIELAAQDEFDATVINDEVQRAAKEVASLMGLE